jgi:hypothetical protein
MVSSSSICAASWKLALASPPAVTFTVWVLLASPRRDARTCRSPAGTPVRV